MSRLVVGHVEPAVALPVEVRAGDHAERHVRAGVLVVAGVRALLEVVAEDRRVPLDLAVGGLGVGVEQQLRRVAAEPLLGLVGPVHAVAVALAGLHVRQVAVPDVGVDLADLDPLLVALGVEQAQLDALGDLAEQREVGAAAVEVRTQGVGGAGPDVSLGSHWHDPITARLHPLGWTSVSGPTLTGMSASSHRVARRRPPARRRPGAAPRRCGGDGHAEPSRAAQRDDADHLAHAGRDRCRAARRRAGGGGQGRRRARSPRASTGRCSRPTGRRGRRASGSCWS